MSTLKEYLLERSKPIVENIFGPLESKRVKIDTDTIRNLNIFIRKIDPRAPLGIEKKLNFRPILKQESSSDLHGLLDAYEEE